MIMIVVKFPVKPEYADQWPALSREFTETTRAEPGNKCSTGPAVLRTPMSMC